MEPEKGNWVYVMPGSRVRIYLPEVDLVHFLKHFQFFFLLKDITLKNSNYIYCTTKKIPMFQKVYVNYEFQHRYGSFHSDMEKSLIGKGCMILLLLLHQTSSTLANRPHTEQKPSHFISYYCGERFIHAYDALCQLKRHYAHNHNEDGFYKRGKHSISK